MSVTFSIGIAVVSWAIFLGFVFAIVFFDLRTLAAVFTGVGVFLISLPSFIFLNWAGFLLFAILTISQLSSNALLRVSIASVMIIGLVATLVNVMITRQPWLQSSNQLLAFLIWIVSHLASSRFLRKFRK